MNSTGAESRGRLTGAGGEDRQSARGPGGAPSGPGGTVPGGRLRGVTSSLERLAQPLGGMRILVLPFLRILAAACGVLWALLTPDAHAGWGAIDTVVLAFAVYSAILILALWRFPAALLRMSMSVLAIDLGFALGLIYLSGGAGSALFLALLVIAGLQSYYHGLARGLGVAVASSVAYLAVVWPTITDTNRAGVAIRLSVLLGTAAALGVLARLEDGERRRIGTLTAQVRARERFIQSVVESLREGVVALDGGGRVVAWNRAMEARHGVAAAETAGRPLLDCLPELAGGPLVEPLRQLLRGARQGLTCEAVPCGSAGGERLICNIKGSPLHAGGEPAGAVLLFEDITERIALERSARQAEKLAALGTLAAGLAHELNNPIGIMSSRIELMLLDAETRPLPHQVVADLRVLHRHAERVTRITQGLLSFARHGHGDHGPVDLNGLVEESLLLMESQIAKRGIEVRRCLTAGLPSVRGEANALQQVIVNLLTNARDALGQGGEIAIETAAAGPQIRLVVRDNGPGIPSDVLPRIFDPFFTTKAEGTGLGLSISYGIIREHQGTVDVQSQAGVGTTFILGFPRADPGSSA